MPAFSLPIFLLGCLGGLLPDALRYIKNRYKPGLPKYIKTINFWVGVILLSLLGGLTAWIVSAGTAKEALIIGYASPQIISELVGGISVTKPRADLGVPEAQAATMSIKEWWAS